MIPTCEASRVCRRCDVERLRAPHTSPSAFPPPPYRPGWLTDSRPCARHRRAGRPPDPRLPIPPPPIHLSGNHRAVRIGPPTAPVKGPERAPQGPGDTGPLLGGARKPPKVERAQYAGRADAVVAESPCGGGGRVALDVVRSHARARACLRASLFPPLCLSRFRAVTSFLLFPPFR